MEILASSLALQSQWDKSSAVDRSPRTASVLSISRPEKSEAIQNSVKPAVIHISDEAKTLSLLAGLARDTSEANANAEQPLSARQSFMNVEHSLAKAAVLPSAQDYERLRKLEELSTDSAPATKPTPESIHYEVGDDGKIYASLTKVDLSLLENPDDPTKTIQELEQVFKEAMAAMPPSPEDRRVAVEAKIKQQKARYEMHASQKQVPAQLPELQQAFNHIFGPQSHQQSAIGLQRAA